MDWSIPRPMSQKVQVTLGHWSFLSYVVVKFLKKIQRFSSVDLFTHIELS